MTKHWTRQLVYKLVCGLKILYNQNSNISSIMYTNTNYFFKKFKFESKLQGTIIFSINLQKLFNLVMPEKFVDVYNFINKKYFTESTS